MYFGSCNGFFRRLDVTTGKVQWETNVRDGGAKQYFFHGDVFIAADRIVAGSDVDTTTGAEAGVHAFDRRTGRQLWKYSAGRGVMGAVIGSDSRVFAYTATGDLIALNLASGKLEWTYAVNAGPWESPAVIADHVLAGSNDGSVYALDSQTGRVQWQQKLGAAVATSIRGTASDVYAGTADGNIHRLALSNGDVRSSLHVDPVLKPTSAPFLGKVLPSSSSWRTRKRTFARSSPSIWPWHASGGARRRRIGGPPAGFSPTPRTVLVGGPSGEVTAYCAAGRVNDFETTWFSNLR